MQFRGTDQSWQRTVAPHVFEIDCHGVTFRLVCKQIMMTKAGPVGAAEFSGTSRLTWCLVLAMVGSSRASQPRGPAMTDLIKFEAGKTYYGRFITDHDAVFKRTVIRRTAKSVWLSDGSKVKQFRVKASWDGKCEEVEPFGRYSMSPTLSANKAA